VTSTKRVISREDKDHHHHHQQQQQQQEGWLFAVYLILTRYSRINYQKWTNALQTR